MVGVGPSVALYGMGPEALANRLGATRCVVLERVPSTLDVVHELGRDGAAGGTLVLAEEQTAGRGRHGRRWLSVPGSAILLGYLERPPRYPGSGVIALRVGLAVRRSLQELGVAAQIKWPNDIMVCDRKLGGILCEARQTDAAAPWIGIGIGLNVRAPVPREVQAQAIALEEVLPGVTRVDVLERLVPLLRELPDSDMMREDEMRSYEQCDWLRGRVLVRPVHGTAQGVAADGALIIETSTGVQRVVGGSVVLA